VDAQAASVVPAAPAAPELPAADLATNLAPAVTLVSQDIGAAATSTEVSAAPQDATPAAPEPSAAPVAAAPKPLAGPACQLIVVGAPWRQMSLAELQKLPVADLAAPESMLWLATDGQRLPDAIDLVRHLGFDFVDLVVVRPETTKLQHGWLMRLSMAWVVAVRGGMEANFYDIPLSEMWDDNICGVAQSEVSCRASMGTLFVDEEVEDWVRLDAAVGLGIRKAG
jgi:hypothetical protein